MTYFKHLKKVNQNYFEHFADSIKYFYYSMKASYFFLIHSLYPDFYETAGSQQIYELYMIILDKYKKIENNKVNTKID